jgi:hypothetical protein
MKFNLAEHDFERYYLDEYDPECTYLPTVEVSEELYESYKNMMKEVDRIQTILAALNCIYGEKDEKPIAVEKDNEPK